MLAVGVRRSRRALAALGLRPGLRGRAVAGAVALGLVFACVGLAAAQPVLRSVSQQLVRTDAQMLVVLDTSRSMLASSGSGEPTRFDRARSSAERIRAALPDVPTGLASFTDRVLPYVFPTSSEETFQRALEHSVGVERPPPSDRQVTATSFFALADVSRQQFFAPKATKRLLVVFTDGESRPFSTADLARILASGPGIATVLVRVGDEGEAIYGENGRLEPGYRPSAEAAGQVEDLAAALGGRAFTEDDLGGAVDAARGFLGDGPRSRSELGARTTPLAPYAILAALVPLGLLLWQRNFR